MMSWFCPFQAVQPPPFMSLTFFHVCPVLSLRVISLHLPSCRLVSLCVVSLSFPLHSPCFHFCPLHVPFSSPWFPFRVPLLSCHVDFLFPPLISLHFLALLPNICRQKHGFSSVFAIRTSKNTEFVPDVRQKKAGTPNQQRAGRESSLGPLFCDTGSPKTTFSGTPSNCRAVGGGGGGGKPCVIDVSGGGVD